MKKKPDVIQSVVGCFGPQLNKLLGLVVFFYTCLIGMNAYVVSLFPNPDDRPSRLTDVFSDAGTLSLGAYLGILKEKANRKKEEEDEDEKDYNEFDKYDGPLV